jgi:hypothetical protein
MRTSLIAIATFLALTLACEKSQPPAASPAAEKAPASTEKAAEPATAACSDCVAVTPLNFSRAETDLYFGNFVKQGGFGKFAHNRTPTPIDLQTVVRMNRDTLYSGAVFDLDAGPVTITLPDPGKRFLSMQVLDEDQYTYEVVYGKGSYTLSKDKLGTRYAAALLRILADPNNPQDLDEVHKLQDEVQVSQKTSGSFDIPKWDKASQDKVRDGIMMMSTNLSGIDNAFGTRQQVNPIMFLIGSALGWGGNPDKEAKYGLLHIPNPDGKQVYRLTVKDVPVDGFWSISVYNAKGYFEPNTYNAYSVNNLTAQKDPDGSVTVQFGGCDGKIPNCLPITPGWNATTRMYRPRAEILSGKWKFPEPQPVS